MEAIYVAWPNWSVGGLLGVVVGLPQTPLGPANVFAGQFWRVLYVIFQIYRVF